MDFTGDEDALAALRDFTLPRLQARLKLSSTITMRTVALRQILSLLFLVLLLNGDEFVAMSQVCAEALAQDRRC